MKQTASSVTNKVEESGKKIAHDTKAFMQHLGNMETEDEKKAALKVLQEAQKEDLKNMITKEIHSSIAREPTSTEIDIEPTLVIPITLKPRKIGKTEVVPI